LIVCLAGCIPVPVYKTLQPTAKVQVVDADDQPISNAEVTLIANAYPYGFEKGRSTETTDLNGVASFSKKSEWRIEAPLMMHGSEVFFWNWCVRKEGYATFVTANRNSRSFDAAAKLAIVKGESSACPRIR
jgi:hypothetical protein